MSIQQIPKASENMSLAELINLVGILIKEVSYLLDGQIDAKNIRAKSITADLIKAGAIIADKIAAGAVTADKIDVNQLSAISANLGIILAGYISGVLIEGSTVQTSPSYPRAFITSTNNSVGFENNASQRASLMSDDYGNPALLLKTIVGASAIWQNAFSLNIDSIQGGIDMRSNGAVSITAPGGLWVNGIQIA